MWLLSRKKIKETNSQIWKVAKVTTTATGHKTYQFVNKLTGEYLALKLDVAANAKLDEIKKIVADAMAKEDLFKTVILDGALPRKTFSMGHANDKRYYLEARKIK